MYIIIVFLGNLVPGKLIQIKGVLVDTSEEAMVFEGFPSFFYEVKNPSLSASEQALIDLLSTLMQGKKLEDVSRLEQKNLLSPSFSKAFTDRVLNRFFFNVENRPFLSFIELNDLKNTVAKLLEEFFHPLPSAFFIATKVVDRVAGYGSIGPFLRDQNLEEIMVNGFNMPVFVFHRSYGMCKTNVSLGENELDFIVQKISVDSQKNFGEKQPFLDSRLSGGDRVNATFSSVTPFGSTLTIRKFTSTPLSIVDLIANKTVSSEVAAFLWVMVEGLNVKPMNMIVTGGSGSGKTTTLNVLCSFVRQNERIITIEDAIELDLGARENWVRLETRPKILGFAEVSMDDLLRNALRMRPDRIILGEVRGVEAQTLFVAMDTGHEGSMGTLHSNNSKEAILRLVSAPMSVPESMLSLLELVIVQARMYVKGKGMLRRVMQISEVSSMDKKALVGNLFEWDRSMDQIRRTDVPSRIIEDLAEKTQMTKKEILREIAVRKKILEFLLERKIVSGPEVEAIIQKYYYDPESVLELIVRETAEEEA